MSIPSAIIFAIQTKAIFSSEITVKRAYLFESNLLIYSYLFGFTLIGLSLFKLNLLIYSHL